MIGDILKHQDVRRFAVTFASVFCVGGLAVIFFLRTANSDAVDAGSAKPIDGKVVGPQIEEETASMSVRNEQDLRGQMPDKKHYKLAATTATATNDQSAEISDSFRTTSSGAMDRQSVGQAVYVANTNVGLGSSSNGGSFTVGNSSVVSEQQRSTAPTSEATGPQVNDLPETNEPGTGKPMLGKMPRGYSYEQLLYRTWYGWGAYNSGQPQDQH